MTQRLNEMGVRDVFARRKHGFGKVVALFSRKKVRLALGLENDPAPVSGLLPAFWQGLDDHLRDTWSSFRVAHHDGSTARLQSQCHRWRAEIEIASNSIVVTTLFDKKSTARAKDAATLFKLAQDIDAAKCARTSEMTKILNLPAVGPRLAVKESKNDWRMSIDRISMSGSPDALLTAFRKFLYRVLVLSVERQRAYFAAADENGPGGLPHVWF